jgi:hypothetical protein
MSESLEMTVKRNPQWAADEIRRLTKLAQDAEMLPARAAPGLPLTRDQIEDAYNAASMYAVKEWHGYQDGNWNVKADFAAALCKLALAGLDAPVSETVAWQAQAYAKLGLVRDSMPPEHVKIVQDFIGELPK